LPGSWPGGRWFDSWTGWGSHHVASIKHRIMIPCLSQMASESMLTVAELKIFYPCFHSQRTTSRGCPICFAAGTSTTQFLLTSYGNCCELLNLKFFAPSMRKCLAVTTVAASALLPQAHLLLSCLSSLARTSDVTRPTPSLARDQLRISI